LAPKIVSVSHLDLVGLFFSLPHLDRFGEMRQIVRNAVSDELLPYKLKLTLLIQKTDGRNLSLKRIKMKLLKLSNGKTIKKSA